MMDGLWPRLTPWGYILWKERKDEMNAQCFEFMGNLKSIRKSGIKKVEYDLYQGIYARNRKMYGPWLRCVLRGNMIRVIRGIFLLDELCM